MSCLDDIKNDRLEVRLAKTPAEILAAQRLRYHVFFEEDGVTNTTRAGDTAIPTHGEKIDIDEFDAVCDHLIAIDLTTNRPAEQSIVGTYRLMRKEGRAKIGKWYSETEFNVEKFNTLEGEILELGRSCVAKSHRNRLTMQMMWNALAAYMFDYKIELMFGCGTFLGTNPDEYADALSYLYYNHVETGAMKISAKGENARPMNLLPKDEIDEAKAMAQMPTMIKGYIRIGARISDSCWIDWGFNGFDVCIIFETKNLRADYLKHYERMKNG
ncbi:MAG: GNAT family N-acetyltransferase [Rickettsiales bacterium]|jgi:putative hemolysin|nr:GNAT family N-acetyltransferase [Rickettsiales bacterium]